jgi:hypothetical protein
MTPRQRTITKPSIQPSLFTPVFSENHYKTKLKLNLKPKPFSEPQHVPAYRHPAYIRCIPDKPGLRQPEESRTLHLSPTSTPHPSRKVTPSTAHLPVRRKPSRTTRKQNCPKLKAAYPLSKPRTLEQMGFTISLKTLPAIPKPSKRHLEQEARRIDYSGTFVSTAP